MVVDKEENYGERLTYDPLWNGPMKQKRRQTDFRFLLAFTGFLVIWTSIVIYGFAVNTGNVKDNDNNNNNTDKFEESSEKNENNIKGGLLTMLLNTFGFFILAAIFSFLYIVLLRWFAKIIVYATIAVICTLLFCTIIVSSYLYSADKTQKELLYTAISSSIIFVITVLYLMFIYKKINIASEVLREASKAVIFFPSLLVLPILSYLAYALLTIYFIYGVFPIYCNGDCETDIPTYVYIFLLIHMMGYLWTMSFVTGFTQMYLSGSFASWYWTMHKHYVPKYTVMHCIATTTRYHLGTVSFGSLVIPICNIISLILDSLKRCIDGRNSSISCLFGWYKYLFENLEKFMKLIDRNAYIMTAIHGTGFMQSTKDVFNLFMRNILNVLVINKITDGILVLGKLHAMGLTLFVAWGYYYNQESLPENLVTIAICSFLITKCYFMVLKTAVDTIFHCVMEDYERNDGSDDRPYYMSFQLKSLLIIEQNDETI